MVKKKRLFSMLTTLAFLIVSLTFSVPVSALGAENTSSEIASATKFEHLDKNTTTNTTVYSEALEYIERKSMTDAELSEIGMTSEEIKQFRNNSMEKALLERATYSDEQLHALGYTDAQIILLRSYDGSELTASNPVIGATAVCTGTFDFDFFDPDIQTFYFVYEFTWSLCPLDHATDGVAVTWRGADAEGHFLVTEILYRRCIIRYTGYPSGVEQFTVKPTMTSIPGFDGYQAEYDMLYGSRVGYSDECFWAKTGTVSLGIRSVGTTPVYTVQAYGAVAHNVWFWQTNVNWGYTPGSSSIISFSFTPVDKIETVGVASYTMKADGTCRPN